MNILVSGIHGFVGSNLVNKLRAQTKIYGLDIVDMYNPGIAANFGWDILSDKDTFSLNLPSLDCMIHLAGKAHDTRNESAAQEYFEINTGLTQKIFDFFLASSAKKFIFFSSVKAAADVVEGDILTEDVTPAPKGPYGESKIKAEEYILENMAHSEACRSGNKRVYILRPCMIHGPGNKGNLNLLYNVVKKGIPWPLGAFENRRSFASIDNVCYVIENLLSKDIASGIYHIGDDDALSTNELIELMCETLGRKVHIWRLNKGFMQGIARLGSYLHLPLNRECLQKLTENYVVSNEKIKNALGIEKMPVSAQQGFVNTIRSFESFVDSKEK